MLHDSIWTQVLSPRLPDFRSCLPKKRCDSDDSVTGGRCNAAQSPNLLVSLNFRPDKRSSGRQAPLRWQDRPNGKFSPVSKSSEISDVAIFWLSQSIAY